jgi:hypothetical protein
MGPKRVKSELDGAALDGAELTADDVFKHVLWLTQY